MVDSAELSADYRLRGVGRLSRNPAGEEELRDIQDEIRTCVSVGYVIQIAGGPTIYHTGDTDVFTDMKLIADFFKVDVMLSAIGGHFTMDPARAAQAVEWVQPKQVIPMHFGTVPILAGTPALFKAALDKRGLGGRMGEMKPGEERSF